VASIISFGFTSVASGKGKGGGKHQRDDPRGVAVDAAGNRLMVDSTNYRVMNCAWFLRVASQPKAMVAIVRKNYGVIWCRSFVPGAIL
jgi:hypothetical protein